mmetsp:Transcript_55998/g.98172  ORF Transcript_55998/g.98172 Transcript_55998/m.98172 type:complete len:242 (+) Transcript_55998:963-1688(+)
MCGGEARCDAALEGRWLFRRPGPTSRLVRRADVPTSRRAAQGWTHTKHHKLLITFCLSSSTYSCSIVVVVVIIAVRGRIHGNCKRCASLSPHGELRTGQHKPREAELGAQPHQHCMLTPTDHIFVFVQQRQKGQMTHHQLQGYLDLRNHIPEHKFKEMRWAYGHGRVCGSGCCGGEVYHIHTVDRSCSNVGGRGREERVSQKCVLQHGQIEQEQHQQQVHTEGHEDATNVHETALLHQRVD